MPRHSRFTDINEHSFLGTLNEELDELTRRMDVVSSVAQREIKDVTIRAVGTEVRHSLGRVPKTISVALKAEAKWWEYRARDTVAIYLKTDVTSVEAEVTIGR